METKQLIIDTFNSDRAANLARIEGDYVGGSLTLAQFVKAVMIRLTSEAGCAEFNYNLNKFDTEAAALAESLESASYAVVNECHPAYTAKLRGDEKRMTAAYKARATYNHQR